jgi:hypothetical protein
MKTIAIVIVLLTLTWVASPAQQKTKMTWPDKPLSLTVSPQLTKYAEGEPVTVRLTFKNTGKKRTTFILPNKGSDPPGFITARAWDEQGMLLTQNDTLEDGWWTVLTQVSSVYREKKSDRISLKPGEAYAFTIDLGRLLRGCRCILDGLRAGTYRVQFSYGAVFSNEVEIRVGE